MRSRLMVRGLALLVCVLLLISGTARAQGREDTRTLRVFIFAGQSNMVGADSKAADIDNFPPFRGLQNPQKKVKFDYCLGREDLTISEGWEALAPIKGMVGPELSFAREVTRNIRAPIAIIKVATGGTHLGGDWNPAAPGDLKLYPRALERVRDALQRLKRKRIRYRLEGFMWHQGENDMFNDEYKAAYGKNLAAFIARWRKDLDRPELPFYIGELCTKTIWGMDLRPSMYAISLGQKKVCEADALATYVPTSHVGVEIGGENGLHYHYGTLGQLQHGMSYAEAYLKSIDKLREIPRKFRAWPYRKGSRVRLFVFAGHRNMEGERAFVQEVERIRKKSKLANGDHRVAFKYDLGAGFRVSKGWEPLGPPNYYGTFGPELSFVATAKAKLRGDIAIAKFTDSGSQIIDWTPEGSEAKSRHVYPRFITFVKEAVRELEEKGHQVDLAGIFYHVGENDMSWGPFRKGAAERIAAFTKQSRKDLGRRDLRWFLTQQPPTDKEGLNRIDVTAAIAKVADADQYLHHWTDLKLPKQKKRLVLDTEGVIKLGETMATRYLKLRLK
jgi:carbohydrate esterase-like sialic acid-specific acetylesterase